MYFWNTKALSEDIKNNKLTDINWKNYYLATSIFLTISMYLVMLTPRGNATGILIEAILMIGVIIFGVSVTFNTHQANSEQSAGYISTMVALSFPLSIKFFVLAFVIGLISGILHGAGFAADFNASWLTSILSIAIQGLIFWRLNTHLKYIAS